MNLRDQAKDRLSKVGLDIRGKGYLTGAISEHDYCFEISFRKSGPTLKLRMYYGKKGVTPVLQGNKSTVEYKEIESILTGMPVVSNSLLQEPPAYIGSDEAGKGEVFGPLVAAAVGTTKEAKEELRSLGVCDSKLLSDQRILSLAQDIPNVPGVFYSVNRYEPALYNEVYEKKQNLNLLVLELHAQCIAGVLEKYPFEEVIIDQFMTLEKMLPSLPFSERTRVHAIHNGEQFTAVAAASILARAEYLRWMNEQSLSIGTTLPIGSGPQSDVVLRKLQKTKGNEILPTVAKMHFKNVTRLGSGF